MCLPLALLEVPGQTNLAINQAEKDIDSIAVVLGGARSRRSLGRGSYQSHDDD